MPRRSAPLKNIVHRLYDRETTPCPPSASINYARKFHQCIYPNTAVTHVDCPNVFFSRFTPDGTLLIGFAAGCQHLVVYQYVGLSRVNDGSPSAQEAAPPGFDSFFKLKYQVAIVHGTELLAQEFAILLNNGRHLLVASQTPPPPSTEPLAPPPMEGLNVPIIESTTFHLVEVATGKVLDVLRFHEDFLHLHFHACISVHDGLLAFTALYTQTIHIVQVTPQGSLLPVRTIGRYCNEDDELTLQLQAEADTRYRAAHPSATPPHRSPSPLPPPPSPPPLGTDTGGRATSSSPAAGSGAAAAAAAPQMAVGVEEPQFVEGLRQRMLAYIFMCASMGVGAGQPLDGLGDGNGAGNSSSNGGGGGVSSTTRAQLGHFFQQFETYRKLVITRCQLLDRSHLLVNMATHIPGRGEVLRTDCPHQRTYFLVYNLHTTRVSAFFHDSSEELVRLFLRHHDDFLALAPQSPWERYISTNMQMARIRDNLNRQDTLKNKPHSFRRALLSLPFAPQTRNPSPYLDPLLFAYNEKVISQFHKTRQNAPSVVKFSSRMRPAQPTFRLIPGPACEQPPPQAAAANQRAAMHFFHPIHPLVLTVVLTPGAAPLMNIHYHQ